MGGGWERGEVQAGGGGGGVELDRGQDHAHVSGVY